MEKDTDLAATLADRLHAGAIRSLWAGAARDVMPAVERLLRHADSADTRTGYNALWVLTHMPRAGRPMLRAHRGELVGMLLRCNHDGKRRLLLTLLDSMPTEPEDVDGEYLDYCLAGINSTAPYAIRALCLKQAYEQCRHYPELLNELTEAIRLMETGELSPGLRSARKNVLKKIPSVFLELHQLVDI